MNITMNYQLQIGSNKYVLSDNLNFRVCLPISWIVSQLLSSHFSTFADFGVRRVEKGRKHPSYPIDYKLRIVEEAKLTSNREVAQAHGIDESTIRKWKRMEDKLRIGVFSGRSYRLEGAGRRPENK